MSALLSYWDDYHPTWSCGSLPARSPQVTRQVLRAVYDDCAAALQPLPVEDKTFCNRMVQEATKSLGCPVPRVVLRCDVWMEQSANAMGRWLENEGPRAGWKRLPGMSNAIQQANAGFPVIVSWVNAQGEGHIGMVLSTDASETVPRIMQAGAVNFFDCPAGQGFGVYLPAARFYSHD